MNFLERFSGGLRPRPITPLTYQSTIVLASVLNFSNQPNPRELLAVGRIEEVAVRRRYGGLIDARSSEQRAIAMGRTEPVGAVAINDRCRSKPSLVASTTNYSAQSEACVRAGQLCSDCCLSYEPRRSAGLGPVVVDSGAPLRDRPLAAWFPMRAAGMGERIWHCHK